MGEQQRKWKPQVSHSRKIVLTLSIGIVSIASAGLLLIWPEENPKQTTREVSELPGASAPASPTMGGPRLTKERDFTYADSAYGKCLKENGVKEFPPLTKPLKLNTNDPVIAKAVERCKSLAPASPIPTAS